MYFHGFAEPNLLKQLRSCQLRPNSLLTVYIGTPLVNVTIVAKKARTICSKENRMI
jgi:hypothetical protein